MSTVCVRFTHWTEHAMVTASPAAKECMDALTHHHTCGGPCRRLHMFKVYSSNDIKSQKLLLIGSSSALEYY